ncbi:hypothetical protein [Polaribacter cellanae]|uniref:Uncharacterized protein n=1 Tax=Polaribacter cellanae TaxID=2818493 RepID=A0A975H5G0_9FLAO|nr:hypothetical protein [Polaribacter cellanae]QTE21376.1 hypothetical protein J3359_11115 [Polaribacter cellanae]
MKKIIQLLLIISAFVTQAQTYLEHKITATNSYLGKKTSVTLTIDDANGDKEITKPLIVVEGFDVGVILSPENEYGYTSYKKDFQKKLRKKWPII